MGGRGRGSAQAGATTLGGQAQMSFREPTWLYPFLKGIQVVIIAVIGVQGSRAAIEAVSAQGA